MNNATTNLFNFHTCATGGVHLVAALVPVPQGELLKLTGDMVSCSGVSVLVGVEVVGGGDGRGCRLVRDALEVGVEALVTTDDGVALLAT